MGTITVLSTPIRQEPITIEFYGQQFTSVGWCSRHQCRIWPVEEFFARHSRMPSDIREKIRELNPNGKCEIELPKGCPRSWAKREKWATPRERV